MTDFPMQQTLARPRARPDREFRPFPNIERRNWLQSRVEIPLMLWALGVPTGGRVLEVGCGRGMGLLPYLRLLEPVRLVAVDIDRQLLNLARARVARSARVELIHADVRDLPFSDGEFDVVIDFGTCYHIQRPDAALREIARVLAGNGIFATESRLSQLLSHPIRTRHSGLPWRGSGLAPMRHAGLWLSRRRVA